MRFLLLFVPLLILSLKANASVDSDCPWEGAKLTEEQLQGILLKHAKWLAKKPRHLDDPLRANLCKADLAKASLVGADLTSALLSNANLTDADLWRANLTYADLNGANLTDASLQEVNFTNASLSDSNLTRAYLLQANLSNANLSGANLTNAALERANLTNVTLSGANLYTAHLSKANLTDAYLAASNFTAATLQEVKLVNANLSDANLTGANLYRTDLTNVRLWRANLSHVIYEPLSSGIPNLDDLVGNESLLTVQYNNPRGLIALREGYDKSGLKDEAKKITWLLNQRKMEKLFLSTFEQGGNSLFNATEWTFNLLFFDLPTDWGLKPGRALKILLFGIGFFMFFYLIALQAPDKLAGVWRVRAKDRLLDKKLPDEELIQPQGFWPALPTAFYFSMLSAFNIGWRDLNVGGWILRVQRKEYTYRATGWVRTVAGIQSLISVYLVAMWALTYFGRPFD